MPKRLKLSRFLYILLFSSTLMAPASAFSLTQEESGNARNAFMFADRKQWDDALSYAAESHDRALLLLTEWMYLLDPGSGASFTEIIQFLDKHPDWPEQKRLRIRAEMMLLDSPLDNDEIIGWFAGHMPVTGVGKIALVNSLQQVKKLPPEKIQGIVREAWRDGDFTEAQERSLLESYSNLIRREDDIERADRLLWEGKITQAERMFKRVGPDREGLYKARIALQGDKKDAPKILSGVTASLRKDIGLTYDRMRYRLRRGDGEGVRELLLGVPKKVPYPEKWWRVREAQIREAMGDGKTSLAAKLLANHGQEKGQGLADASWLKGRLLLEYQKHPKDAYQVFYRMFSEVKYPVSKSRAAYWAAKAAKKAGDDDAFKTWMNTASSYPTTFYGQLASLVHNGTAPLRIPAPPVIDAAVRDEFNSRSIVRAIKLCIAFNQPEIAGKLINHLVETADNDSEALLASELGAKAGKAHLSVRGAKKALQNNIVLIAAGYPAPKTPERLSLPRELTLSIIRQESEFDGMARSPSGALGLMQLLPSTAKETAGKNSMDYDISRLYEPEYNMKVGSLYLQKLIDRYDGSVIMAVAAYNAGPGNLYKWVQNSGKPKNTIDGAVDWIENIPFAETRNYVQRVLENLQVYRYIEAQSKEGGVAPKLLLGEDLVR